MRGTPHRDDQRLAFAVTRFIEDVHRRVPQARMEPLTPYGDEDFTLAVIVPAGTDEKASLEGNDQSNPQHLSREGKSIDPLPCAFFCITVQDIRRRDREMESQLTLRLPALLAEKLDRAARDLRRKRSEVVRLALEQFLNAYVEVPPIERVRDLLGKVESGLPDLGQRHRDYMLKRLRHGG